jgi:hypothetical protein
MEPARSLDSRVDALERSLGGSRPGEGDLNGVCEGLGRDVLEASAGMPSMGLPAAPGENLEGNVPARARRVCGRVSGVGNWAKSGKPSVGDSGMFSRSGVEFPLVGGPPQGFSGKPGTPSWAWISLALYITAMVRGRWGLGRSGAATHRLENKRPAAAISCEGEPAPEREAPDILEVGVRPGDKPKGDRRVLPADCGSFGEVVVGEFERPWADNVCGG